MMTPDRESLLRSDVCGAIPHHNLELDSMANAWVSASVASRTLADPDPARDLETLSSGFMRTGERCALPERSLDSGPAARRDPGIEGTLKREFGQRFQRILVAYDGSSPAQHAVEIALALAGFAMSTVLILAVIKPSEPDDSSRFQAVLEDTRRRYESSFASLRERARGAGINLKTWVIVGKPAEEIISRAGAMHADLIVMGRHGKSAIRRFMLGSNSERVIQNAQCPVMLVH